VSHALPRLPGVRWVVDSIPIARTNNNSTGFFVTTSSCRPAVSCVGDVDLPFFSEPSGAAKRLEDGFALKIGIVSEDFVDRAAGANPSEEHQEIPLRRYAWSLQFPQFPSECGLPKRFHLRSPRPGAARGGCHAITLGILGGIGYLI
jgi:hypothetical protein